MPTAMLPTLTIGAIRNVSSGVSILRTATMRTQNSTIAATYAKALRTCTASAHWTKLTRRSFQAGRHATSGEGERADPVEVAVDEARRVSLVEPVVAFGEDLDLEQIGAHRGAERVDALLGRRHLVG